MPNGPKGEKRPADAFDRAIKGAKFATDDIEEDKDENGQNKAAQSLGRRGGNARAQSLASEERKKITKKAATARWAKK